MPLWGIFKKSGPATIENRLKVIILVSGLFLALVLASAGGIKVTTSSQFCTRCHVMAPEYATWSASSHLQVECVKCHRRPGLGNLILNKATALKELLLYTTGTYELPIKMSDKIDDQVCTQCHSQNRDFTPSGDLIIPHDKHAAKQVQCVECHSGVAHGNIVARAMTEDGKFEVWTAEVGKEQMAREYAEPKMNTCLECHIKRKITQACEACHTTISLPPDHKVKDWGVTHGHLAAKDLNYCNKCHSYSVEAKNVPAKDPVARYARGNVFCYDCHQKRPSGHTEGWRMEHKRDVINREVSGCLVCHNSEKATPKDRAVPTYCGKCHGQTTTPKPANNSGGTVSGQNGTSGQNGQVQIPPRQGSTTLGKIHPANWRKLHPSIVKEKGASNEGCWNCHETTHCSKCHMNKL